VQATGGGISVTPGGGIQSGNLSELLRAGAREFHSGLGSARDYNTEDFTKFEMEVCKLASQIRKTRELESVSLGSW
jgi:copper homeostasis protein CutC